MTTTQQTRSSLTEYALLHEAERDLPVAYRQVMQALRLLDGQCDGAKGHDSLGFSRVHVKPGHDFATLYRARGYHLTPAQFAYAYRIVSTYSRQLPEAVSPIDEKIDAILLQKQERVLKTLDGNLNNLPPNILFKNIASSLVDEVMATRRGTARSREQQKKDVA